MRGALPADAFEVRRDEVAYPTRGRRQLHVAALIQHQLLALPRVEHDRSGRRFPMSAHERTAADGEKRRAARHKPALSTHRESEAAGLPRTLVRDAWVAAQDGRALAHG
ncbi:hypothetical protein [Gemmatimonas sp. UBA7669]|uniref:hypothetical protein n=1 Tax=Gemmatimonas sp. UBA7669 TaxID=1946568 RepID=UPI0025B7C29E|nr:hypothetical protein [Gemmatimonas sp. UBA7669]